MPALGSSPLHPHSQVCRRCPPCWPGSPTPRPPTPPPQMRLPENTPASRPPHSHQPSATQAPASQSAARPPLAPEIQPITTRAPGEPIREGTPGQNNIT
ncbi:hypothetical protein DSO57_1003776 [Entomophthora muscae]|uniref:Uncharacterized protein n=1 Tax=Entomophthora muscae TaxID=34485 RepID=A0ACC2TJP8_9FUNG|nr:hypothetical protein DSO57_1003776 [Entomophthora muscae]